MHSSEVVSGGECPSQSLVPSARPQDCLTFLHPGKLAGPHPLRSTPLHKPQQRETLGSLPPPGLGVRWAGHLARSLGPPTCPSVPLGSLAAQNAL